MSLPFTDNVKALDAVASTTTSEGFDISKRQQVTVQFICTGATAFTIDVSNDGTNWVTGVAFLDAAQTSVGTYVTSKSLSNTTAGAVVTPGFKLIRVKATVTTGTATAVIESAG